MKTLFKQHTDWTEPDHFPDLSKYDEISIDLETKDPDLKTRGSSSTRNEGDVVGIAVAVKDWAGYFPIAHEAGPNMNRKQVLDWFADVLKTDSLKIFHNAIYDMCWIHRLGLKTHGTVVDTMVVASLVDENRFRYDLNSVANDYVGMGKNETALKEAAKEWGVDPKAEMYKLPAMYVGEYAEQDAEITLALWQEFKKEINAQDLHAIVELEQQVFPCLLDMKLKGVRVDEDQIQKVESTLQKNYDAYMKRVHEEIGFYPEVWAAASIEKACIARNVNDFDRTEKTGKPSFTKNYLKNHKDPVLRAINSAREADKLRNTFVDSLKKFVHNGRIHSDIHQLKGDFGGTVTGRLSYSNPNLQQIPNYTDIGNGVRSIFVPEKGHKWGCFDYSQQEPRLVVHFALSTPGVLGVASIAESYEKGQADFHEQKELNLDPKKAKTLFDNYHAFYGMGKAKLANSLGYNDEDAGKVLKQYHQRVPFVKQLIQQVMNRAQDSGKIRTLLGRRCRFNLWEPNYFGVHKPLKHEDAIKEHGPGIRRAFTYKALNKLIQGSAADMTKKTMVDLRSEGITPLIQLHDELDISVESEEQAKKIREIMEGCVELKVPNKVDYEVGDNWGDISDEPDDMF